MKTEKTLASIFLLGILAKLFDIPGSSLLLIFSAAVISIIYFPVAFYFFSDKSLKNQNIALSIVGGMMLAIMPLGVLFKLMFWPGAITELTASLIFAPLLLAITFWLSKNNEELKTYYTNYITRIIFWFVLCLILYFTPNSTLIKIQHRNDPELARLKIQAYENPTNIEYDMALQDYYRQRDSLYMIQNPE